MDQSRHVEEGRMRGLLSWVEPVAERGICGPACDLPGRTFHRCRETEPGFTTGQGNVPVSPVLARAALYHAPGIAGHAVPAG